MKHRLGLGGRKWNGRSSTRWGLQRQSQSQDHFKRNRSCEEPVRDEAARNGETESPNGTRGGEPLFIAKPTKVKF